MPIVFLSSTFLDLQDHRAKVIEAFIRLRHVGVDVDHRAMEAFPASLHHDSLRVALDMVDESDWFVGVLARRYGSLPLGRDRSFTEFEYERAVERDMPRALFLMDEESSEWNAAGPEPDPAKTQLLSNLRDRFKRDRNVDRFDSPGDLSMKVTIALLPDLFAQHQSEVGQPIAAYLGRPPGRVATIALTAAAPVIRGDGSEKSTVTAYLFDSTGSPVDGETVLWAVGGAGSIDPVITESIDGSASAVVSPYQGSGFLTILCTALNSGITYPIRIDLV